MLSIPQPDSLSQFIVNSPVVQTFIDKFPLAVTLVVNHKIRAANEAYAKILGFESAQELIGLTVEQFVDESDREHFINNNSNNYAALIPGGVYYWKYRIHGKIKYIEGHPTAFSLGNDQIVISTIIDVTDKVLREERLKTGCERLERENKRLQIKLQKGEEIFIGEGPAMRKTMHMALQMGKNETNLVITGETGTGKSMLAKIIHNASSRRNEPFVMVNCAAIPDSLLENEFFGHVKGAFTGAQDKQVGYLGAAHKGTLFLDEVGELAPSMQAKLLHAIEEKRYIPIGGNQYMESDVRLICATNRDLVRMVKEGKLREDFFYRIFVVNIAIPPLRERKDDLPRLVKFFFNKFNTLDISPQIPDHLMEIFLAYEWPGNVRELQNVILRYLATGQVQLFSSGQDKLKYVAHEEIQTTKEETLEQVLLRTEREYILKTMDQCQGSKIRTAEKLGVNLRTFHRRCAKLGI